MSFLMCKFLRHDAMTLRTSPSMGDLFSLPTAKGR